MSNVILEHMTPQERKKRPVFMGVLNYFPNALAEVAYTSFVGNEQHNPGQKLHWAKEKSTDHEDALVRHLLSRGTRDTDGVRHSAKVAWRALAMLEMEIEEEMKAQAQGIGEGPVEVREGRVEVDKLTGRPLHPTNAVTGATPMSVRNNLRLPGLAEVADHELQKAMRNQLEKEQQQRERAEEDRAWAPIMDEPSTEH